jgi:hypothetical protein
MNPMLHRIIILIFATMITVTCKAQYEYNYSTGRSEYKMKHYNFMEEYSKAKAAGKNLTGFLRNETVFTYLFSNFKYEQHFRSIDYLTGEATYDTTISMDLKPKIALGISGNSSMPICDLGEKAALLFNYGTSFNYIKFEMDSLHLGNNYATYRIVAWQWGVPLTIDYKTGCEAFLDKSGTTMGFGVGLIPTMSFTEINLRDATTSFRAYPYAKAEIGFFWKICMKLRVSCQLGKYNFLELDNYGSNHYENNSISLKSGPIYGISLVVMPLSFDWNAASWY